ncbi:hypothetical protein GQ42DRAFT_157761 [Ramicandelaber brevisporus]|nr:hypothetical protein GQ42DRAFT_157761 [Ramicandelaber brevisporus]
MTTPLLIRAHRLANQAVDCEQVRDWASARSAHEAARDLFRQCSTSSSARSQDAAVRSALTILADKHDHRAKEMEMFIQQEAMRSAAVAAAATDELELLAAPVNEVEGVETQQQQQQTGKKQQQQQQQQHEALLVSSAELSDMRSDTSSSTGRAVTTTAATTTAASPMMAGATTATATTEIGDPIDTFWASIEGLLNKLPLGRTKASARPTNVGGLTAPPPATPLGSSRRMLESHYPGSDGLVVGSYYVVPGGRHPSSSTSAASSSRGNPASMQSMGAALAFGSDLKPALPPRREQQQQQQQQQQPMVDSILAENAQLHETNRALMARIAQLETAEHENSLLLHSIANFKQELQSQARSARKSHGMMMSRLMTQSIHPQSLHASRYQPTIAAASSAAATTRKSDQHHTENSKRRQGSSSKRTEEDSDVTAENGSHQMLRQQVTQLNTENEALRKELAGFKAQWTQLKEHARRKRGASTNRQQQQQQQQEQEQEQSRGNDGSATTKTTTTATATTATTATAISSLQSHQSNQPGGSGAASTSAKQHRHKHRHPPTIA